MPKDKVEIDSTSRSNPYITKGISKSLLTPCRQVGLSRKRKTPNSAPSSCAKNETTPGNLEVTPVTSKDTSESSKRSEIAQKPKKSVSKCLIPDGSGETSNLEVTPVTSKVASSEDTSQSSKTSEIAQKPKKSVSKCLIDGRGETSDFEVTPVTSKVAKAEDKSETSNTSETAKKTRKSISKRLIVDGSDGTSPSFSPSEELGKNVKSKKSKDVYRNIKKIEDDDFTSDDSSSNLPLNKFKEKLKNDKGNKHQRLIVEDEKSSSQTSDENINISIKKATHDKIKTVKNKRLLIDDEDDDDFKTDTNKMKKTEDKNVNKKKRLIIIEDEDDEDFSSISGVEKMKDEKESPKSKSPLKGFPEKKEDRVSSVVDKNEKKKLERVLSVEIEDIKKKPVLAEIQIETNPKKEEKKSRLTLRRSLSMKKSSDDLQEKFVILKDCTVNLVDTSKIKSEHSYSSDLSEEDVNKFEREVEAKRKIVEDLKQAEIYKRLHNVEDLKKLTATWKNGSISALNDLLPHLQAQSPTNMKTLLKDLGVPDRFITLSETGELR